jgi:hypothetical protein
MEEEHESWGNVLRTLTHGGGKRRLHIKGEGKSTVIHALTLTTVYLFLEQCT